MNYKRECGFVLISLLLISGCAASSNSTSANIDVSASSQPTTVPTIVPAVSPNIDIEDEDDAPDGSYEAWLYQNVDDDNCIPTTLTKSSIITIIPIKGGYHFVGYSNNDNIPYVDKNGVVLRNYHGSETLKLYADFEPDEYLISFYNGDVKMSSQARCKYDDDIRDELIFGKIVDNQSRCIIGFSDSKGNELVNVTNKGPIYIKDILSAINTNNIESKEINLQVEKTDLSFQNQRLDSYSVKNGGVLTQQLNNEGEKCDLFKIPDNVDIEALKELGYTKAIISFDCGILPENGNQRIVFLSEWPQKNKDLNKSIIIDSGEIKFSTKDTNEEQMYSLPEEKNTVSIDDISEGIWVGYDALRINTDFFTFKFDASWTSSSCNIKVQFVK